MFTLRAVVVLEVIVAAVLVVGTAQNAGARKANLAADVRDAMAMPGTGLCAMSDAQALDLARRAERLLDEGQEGYGLGEFLSTVRLMKRTGATASVRVYEGDRSLLAVCRELGDVMLRQQRQRSVMSEERIDDLVQVLVDGELRLADMARVHRMDKEVLLNSLATGADIMVGSVRVGWL